MKSKRKPLSNKHLDMITTIIGEILGDYQSHGYSHSDIKPIMKEQLNEYFVDNKLELTKADWKAVADVMKSFVEGGEGWSLEDVKFLRGMFKAKGVAKFEVELNESEDDFEW